MSQLNVNTIGARTGTTVTLASGHTAVGFGAITEYDQWQLVNSTSPNTNGDLSGTWTRFDHLGATYIGTGMSVSSGIFTFPSTGLYAVKFQAFIRFSGYAGGYAYIYSTNDNGSTWDNIASMEGQGQTNYDTANIYIEVILDIQNTSNDKVRFRFYDEGNATLVGSNDYAPTSVTFYKLGET